MGGLAAEGKAAVVGGGKGTACRAGDAKGVPRTASARGEEPRTRCGACAARGGRAAGGEDETSGGAWVAGPDRSSRGGEERGSDRGVPPEASTGAGSGKEGGKKAS